MAVLIRAKHAVLGVVCEVPDTDEYLKNGWTRVADDAPLAEDSRDLFDPSAHNVDEVVAYLGNTSDAAEHDRVRAAEKAGKGRATILGWSA